MPAPTSQFFTGQMPFLSPNQQRQSAEGKTVFLKSHTEKEMSSHTVDLVVCVTASFP